MLLCQYVTILLLYGIKCFCILLNWKFCYYARYMAVIIMFYLPDIIVLCCLPGCMFHIKSQTLLLYISIIGDGGTIQCPHIKSQILFLFSYMIETLILPPIDPHSNIVQPVQSRSFSLINYWSTGNLYTSHDQ